MIAGFKGTTMIDFPGGKISSIIYFSGCNLHCPYCYNKVLAKPTDELLYFSEDKILKQLEVRRKFIDGVVITGGEATLYNNLDNFLLKIKRKFPNLLIKLDTNGVNPDIIKKLIDNKLVNFISLDIKTSLDKYYKIFSNKEVAKEIKQSIEIVRSCDSYEYRTTITKKLFNIEVAKNISKFLKHRDSYYIQNFQLYSKELILNYDMFSDVDNSFTLDEAKEICDPIAKKCKINFRGF